MADDLREIKDQAAREMARGNWGRAFESYAELCRAEPRDGQWSLRAGDALRKLDRQEEALRFYERAVEAFHERGFLVRAIAVAKLVAELSGDDSLLRQMDQGPRSGSLPEQADEPVVASPPAASPAPPRPTGAPPPPPLEARLAVPPLTKAPAAQESDEIEVEVEFMDEADGIVLEDDGGVDKLDLALLRRLPAIPLFADMPEGAFFDLTTRMKTLTFGAGEVVARQGDPPGPLYVIIDGSAMVKVGEDEVINRLGAGDVFGEMSLLLDEPRRATVMADAPLEVFEIDRKILTDAINRYPGVAEVLARLVKSRLVDLLLATAPLFMPFDGSSRRDLLRRFELREVPVGTALITEGLPGDGLYVVVSGRFEVRRGEADVVARLGPGDVFGEISLLTHSEANATVEAVGAGMVLRLPRKGFQETIVLYPPLLEHISQLASERSASKETTDGSLVFS